MEKQIILVAVKRVVDYSVHVRLKTDGSGVETSHVKMSVNPFDEIALEEAIRLKEQGAATEVIAVSIGGNTCQETLRTALAMGADQAILIETDQAVEPLAAAKLFAAVAARTQATLFFLGKQAIDTDQNQTGQMLAGLLGWAQGTFASKVTMQGDHVEVVREVDGGLETLRLALPAVITADLRLNQPRYLSLPAIVKAKTKPLTVIPSAELGVEIAPRQQILKVAMPEKIRQKIRLESAEALVKQLRDTGVIA